MSDWGTFPQSWGPSRTGRYVEPPLPKPGGPGLPDGEWRMIANSRIWRLVVRDGEIDPETGPGSTSFPLINVVYETVQGERGACYRVSFERRIELDGDKPDIYQQWVGYLFWSDTNQAGDPLDSKYRLAGTYEQVEASGQNHSGGWYATIDRHNIEEPTDTLEFG